MISFNLKVPFDTIPDIESKANSEFLIIHRVRWRARGMVFIIESTEEEYTAIKLKYGEDVWIR